MPNLVVPPTPFPSQGLPLSTLRFVVEGIPRTTQTGSVWRVQRPGKKDRMVPSRSNPKWSAWAGACAKAYMNRRILKPFDCPVSLGVSIRMPRLKNMRTATPYPMAGPDIDNALKGIKDAWQGIVYMSDRQVVRYHLIERVWAPVDEEPGLHVQVIPLGYDG